MSRHTATVEWSLRPQDDFVRGRYSRVHRLVFDGGTVVAGSPALSNVPMPWADEGAVDPEEMFVASLSACHMLWFLHKAREAGVTVSAYRDDAIGEMTKDADGKVSFTRVTLRPEIASDGDAAMLEKAHHEAHEACFIANSVKTEIVIEPVTQAISKEA